MNLRCRLAKLERKQSPGFAFSLVSLDDQGRIRDDGSPAVREWVGRHCRDLPRTVKVYIGIDISRV